MFEWSISVELNSVFLLDIFQFEVHFKAMGALNNEIPIIFGLPCHVSNAESAYVVLATCRYEHIVEVSETYWTTVLEYLLLINVSGKIINELDIFF